MVTSIQARNLRLHQILLRHRLDLLRTLQKPKTIIKKATTKPSSNAKKFILPKSFKNFKDKKFQNDFVDVYIINFLKSPNFEDLLSCLRDEVENFTQFCDNTKAFYPQLAEYYLSTCDYSGSDRECPKDMIRWQNRSIFSRIYFKLAQKPVTGSRLSTTPPNIAEFFTLLRKIPKFSQNIVLELVSKCELSSIPFINTLQSQLDFKNTSTVTYGSAIRQLAKHFDFLESQTDNVLFYTDTISHLQIAEFLNDRLMSRFWQGGRASQVVYALQKHGHLLNIPKFSTQFWFKFTKWAKKTFCKPASAGTNTLSISLDFVIIWYYALLRRGHIRTAEFIRFCCLCGQRAIDFKFLRRQDITVYIDHLRVKWLWGKTRTRASPWQVSFLAKSIPNQQSKFFNIEQCVQTLKRLQPPGDYYLLRFTNHSDVEIEHTEVLTNALQFFPQNVEILQPAQVKAYDFKKLLASSLSKTSLQPQVVSHYLKHALTKSAFCSHMQTSYPWFSKTSVRYAIQINQIPFIRQEFDRLYAAVELRLKTAQLV